MKRDVSSKIGLVIVVFVIVVVIALTNFLVNEGLFVPSHGMDTVAIQVVWRGLPIIGVVLLFIAAWKIIRRK